MIICPKHKLVYLAPPKTGSTAVKTLLMSRRFGGRILGRPEFAHHDVVWQPRFQDWTIFISVRNPYRRMISMWQFSLMRYHKRRRDKFTDFFSTIFPTDDHSFTAFMNSQTVLNCSQSVWRYAWQLHKLQKPVDYVLYQERLGEDLRKIPQFAGERLKQVNTSCSMELPWYKLYTPDAIAKVKTWYAVDFERFGYNPEFQACVDGTSIL